MLTFDFKSQSLTLTKRVKRSFYLLTKVIDKIQQLVG